MDRSTASPSLRVRNLTVTSGHGTFGIELATPVNARGLVLLVRGNRDVVDGRPFAECLHEEGLATATCQILTWLEREHEFARHEAIANIELLTTRLVEMLDALRGEALQSEESIGMIGSGTVAAAMLQAAARRPLDIDAVICRDGCVALAGEIEFVQAPVLLIVTGAAAELLRQNDEAFGRLRSVKDLCLIPSPGRPGTDARANAIATSRAREWLSRHLHAAVHA
jgi:putative phosphoribosyl transferase